MPYRYTPFVSDQFYHVYNRGVARLPIFTNKREYNRFLSTLFYYQYTDVPIKLSSFLVLAGQKRKEALARLVESAKTHVRIVCYVLMPNHFHLLLQQAAENGIATFVGKSCNSYAKYGNIKHRRVGPLFQGPFRAVRVETDEQLLHLSRYIHLNPLVSYLVKKTAFLSYPWSSLPAYIGHTASSLWTEPVLRHFKTKETYQRFVLDHADYAKTLEDIKHIILEREK